MILIIGFLVLAAALLSIFAFHISAWCLNRRLNILVYLVLAALGAGTVYGLLRLSGVIVFPSDHTWSVDFFDASWRDDGVRFLVLFGGTFAGTAVALLPRRHKGGDSSGAQIEEKT
ncbi:hypothetical protein [uncultured Oscillibacter sp.]|uniref:hypothetical protein n=1 Tax=uncultured Oscillibacter sp. TaxID=876091 RepID=UPI0026365FF2|nr:hypothetical protein [uncultured Oscillibacter sp.]